MLRLASSTLRRVASARAPPPALVAALQCVPGYGSCQTASISSSAVRCAPKKKEKGAAAASAPAPAAAAGGDADSDAASGKDLKGSLAKHVEYAKKELSKLRGATASPTMLDHVTVEAYGETQPLPGVAQIVLKNPQLLVVNPFDAALVHTVSDAIRDADLNLNPSVDGNSVRVPVPKSSKETREATVKLISKIAEQGKTRIRRVRQSALDELKKAAGVSEDDTRRASKDIEDAVAAATKEVAAAADKKKLEIEAS